ncbi:hypothetical protein VTI74DRAFT_1838 [Chaetomium olivicolor]
MPRGDDSVVLNVLYVPSIAKLEGKWMLAWSKRAKELPRAEESELGPFLPS